jgi:hypothetical protein
MVAQPGKNFSAVLEAKVSLLYSEKPAGHHNNVVFIFKSKWI